MNTNRINIDNSEKEESPQKSKDLIELGEKYRRLITLKSPSDKELNQIDRILELASYDTELDNLINEIDLEIMSNMNSVEIFLESKLDYESKAVSEASQDFSYQCNNYVAYDSSPKAQNTFFTEGKTLRNSPRFINVSKGKLIGGLSLIVIGLLSHCHQIIFSSTFSHDVTIQADGERYHARKQPQNNIPTSIDNGTNLADSLNGHGVSQPSFNKDSYDKNRFTDPEIQNGYDYIKKLKSSNISQPSERIALIKKAEKIQFKAESKQKKAESEQHKAEHKQLVAESENHNDLALKWRRTAQTYLSESRQWLHLAQTSVALVKQL